MDIASSSLNSAASTPTSISMRRDERRIHGVVWRRCAHIAHPHRGKESSIIWGHGDSYILSPKPHKPAHWICDHCDSIIAPQSNRSTSNVRRHLKLKHRTLYNELIAPQENESAPEDTEQQEEEHIPQNFN